MSTQTPNVKLGRACSHCNQKKARADFIPMILLVTNSVNRLNADSPKISGPVIRALIYISSACKLLHLVLTAGF